MGSHPRKDGRALQERARAQLKQSTAVAAYWNARVALIEAVEAGMSKSTLIYMERRMFRLYEVLDEGEKFIHRKPEPFYTAMRS